MAAGRRFLLESTRRGRVVVAYHGDVDGLSAALLAVRILQRLGAHDVVAVTAGKGEQVHAPSMRERICSFEPEALVVVDMGSRSDPILPGTPTLVLDHHTPRGFPPAAVVVSAHGHPPIAPSSLLTYLLGQGVAELKDLGWLALLGTVADLGIGTPIPEVRALLRGHSRRDVTEAVSLLNAAKRSASHDVATAFRVLERAGGPADIARGRVEGVERLRAYREELRAEVTRCSRTAPRFAGRVALLLFSSAAQVHPLVAVRWSRRLRGHLVIAANEGYLPGRVNFSVRSAEKVDLIAFLRGIEVDGEGEYAYGHAEATGGSLSREAFFRMLRAMGFGEDVAGRAA